ncbi:hypothetical protein LbFV_ORF12 [Leptopilina boulardi filamentous virus]|uniref:Uncharacterized protein n=1 Tax=Leptopilina boulardi filamentous virus TaxID=552509 RepID=A0A1S5YD26_9VIRU|nr:hypothetical protein LbFV_ORF12 [Leptopilina boulardi filamentous virus]AQQ79932.1 hypothetical protein LbFV_ORF12 [Leptopilina boulardi filamentous virus]
MFKRIIRYVYIYRKANVFFKFIKNILITCFLIIRFRCIYNEIKNLVRIYMVINLLIFCL